MYSLSAPGGILSPNSHIYQRSANLGLVCQFAARLPRHAQMPLGTFVSMAQAALQVGQLKLYFNGSDNFNTSNECVGYVIWAMLTQSLYGEFIRGKGRPLAEWEWNDGTNPWILDMAVGPGSLQYVLEDLRDVVFKECTEVTYYRLRHGRRLCKRVARSDQSSFMAAGRQAIKEP